MKPVIIIAIAFVLLIPISIDVVFAQSSTSSSYSGNTSYTPTKITLDTFPNSAKMGQIITFSGMLTANGQGLPNAEIIIKDEDLADLNDVLTSTITDSTGKFSVNWKVKNVDSGDRKFSALILDLYGGFGEATQLNHLYNIAEANTVEIYAEFLGNSQYSKSNTCLIENVDGVLQSNCNNKILSIQDDSSFENLIMSIVLGEMGVTTDSLESILTNQADSTDVANFENLLLEALQDELDLGDTDLNMQEMLDLLEDPSLAVNYNAGTIPTTTDYDIVIKINKSIERLTLLFNELSNITYIDITAVEIKNVEHLQELNSLKIKFKQINSKLEIVKENYKMAQKRADQKHYTSALQILTNLETSLRVILDDYYSFDRDLRNLVKEVKNENYLPPEKEDPISYSYTFSEKPQMKKQQCGDGTELVNGVCEVIEDEEPETQKSWFSWIFDLFSRFGFY